MCKKKWCLRVHINNNAFQVVPSSQYETTAAGAKMKKSCTSTTSNRDQTWLIQTTKRTDGWLPGSESSSRWLFRNYVEDTCTHGPLTQKEELATTSIQQGWITRHHLNSSAILGWGYVLPPIWVPKKGNTSGHRSFCRQMLIYIYIIHVYVYIYIHIYNNTICHNHSQSISPPWLRWSNFIFSFFSRVLDRSWPYNSRNHGVHNKVAPAWDMMGVWCGYESPIHHPFFLPKTILYPQLVDSSSLLFIDDTILFIIR